MMATFNGNLGRRSSAEGSSEDEIELAIRMSLEESERDKERRRMAGIFDELVNDGTTQRPQWVPGAEDAMLNDAQALAASAEEIINQISGSLTFSKDMPFEEQLRLAKELSKRHQQVQQKSNVVRENNQPMNGPLVSNKLYPCIATEESELMDPVSNISEPMNTVSTSHSYQNVVTGDINDEDEELKKALAMSLDPKEQVVESYEKFHPERITPRIDAERSTSHNGNSLTSEHDDEDEDEMLKKAIEASKKTFEIEKLKQEYLNDTLLTNDLKKLKGCRRPIVIDGNNVAYSHTNNTYFSSKGILLCYNYFLNKGHDDIVAYCSATKKLSGPDQVLLQRLIDCGIVKHVTNRKYGNKTIQHYDDLYVLQTAKEIGGIVISNDKFRDVHHSNQDLRQTIEKSVLSFKFVGDRFIPALDPLGRGGPNLEKFLKF